MRKKIFLSLLLWLLPHTVVASDEGVHVLVVYHSVKGHTRAMAEAVGEGARSVEGVTVKRVPVAEARTADVLEADAIIVGSPVFNANVAPEIQSFINGWPFRGAPLADKIGAAFVSAGAISAGEETVQLGILRSMLVFGMIVVGGSEWRNAFGASAVWEEGPFRTDRGPDDVNELFLEKGRSLGRRVAELAVKLEAAKGKTTLSDETADP